MSPDVQRSIDAVERVFRNQFARREAIGSFAAATRTLPDAERREALRALFAMYERQGPAQERVLQCIECGRELDTTGLFCVDCVDSSDRDPA
jgi:hypothetical protein